MKKFISNFLLAIVFSLFILVLFVYMVLPVITNQGETVSVPDVSSMSPAAAAHELSRYNLKFEIEDSTFEEHLNNRAVVSQYPEAGKKVKVNREIDLIINKVVPPDVKMPQLVNKSLELARHSLKGLGLNLGEIKFKPFYADSLVLQQRYNNRHITKGEPIPITASVDLVIGITSDKTILMPDLNNKGLDEVRKIIENNQLILNEPQDYSGEVVRQYPMPNSSVRRGSLVEVTLR